MEGERGPYSKWKRLQNIQKSGVSTAFLLIEFRLNNQGLAHQIALGLRLFRQLSLIIFNLHILVLSLFGFCLDMAHKIQSLKQKGACELVLRSKNLHEIVPRITIFITNSQCCFSKKYSLLDQKQPTPKNLA